MPIQEDSAPQDAFEQAKALASQAIDLLLAHRIPPVPPHYAVTYTYWSGAVSDVARILDELFQAGKPLDEDLLRSLYEQYLIVDPYNRYRGMRTGLQQILQAILHAVQTADQGSAEFARTLEENIQALATARDPAALQAIAGNLLTAANDASQRNLLLQHELEVAHHEVESIRDELEQHRRAAMIDSLTGLFNRRAMDKLLDELLAASPDEPLSMLLLDIDHFKHINDSYGHAIGDVVIRHVADTMRKCIRGEDIGVRYGGEEFIIILPKTPLSGALRVAETIRGRIAALRLVRRQDKFALDPFTISIGVAQRRAGDTAESLFQRADQALYRSKSGGRDRVTAEDASD